MFILNGLLKKFDMTDKTEKTRQAKANNFDKIISEVRKSISLMSTYCIGCTVLKKEGCRSYSERAPIIQDHCSICHKPIYHSASEK